MTTPFEQMHQAAHALLAEELDPEDVLFVAMNRAEVMLWTLGLSLVSTAYPCLAAGSDAGILRVQELMDTQEFGRGR